MGAALVALGTIAASLVFSQIVSDIDAALAKGKVDTQTVLKFTDRIINEARSKGASVYNQALNKLNNIQLPSVASSHVRDVLRTTRKEASENVAKIQDQINAVENKITTHQNRVNAYNALSDHEKLKQKDIADELKNEANQLAKEYNLIGVEKKI